MEKVDLAHQGGSNMDARDITTPVPVVEDYTFLEHIYELQKGLIDHYVKIEGLPQYPIDVNPKKSQILIKDFVGRVIEELGEAYESMLMIDELSQKNNLWTDKFPDDELHQCINHLQNVSEELADSMHFMVELLIFLNIQPDDIHRFIIKKMGGDKPLQEMIYQDETVSDKDILAIAMTVGSFQERDINDIYSLVGIDLWEVFKENFTEEASDEKIDPVLYIAARNYHHIFYNDIKKVMWDVTYHLNIARNFLKNKPWKQSQMMTDEIKFQAEIVEGFIALAGLYHMLGLNSNDLFHIYFKKNQANAFRIRSNY